MNHFTSVNDVSDPPALVAVANELKSNPLRYRNFGIGKTLGLIFFNPSLRTRLSTQNAAHNLGMDTVVMNINEDGWKLELEDNIVMDGEKAEHIKEAAAVISQYCDIVGVRSFPTLSDRESDYQEKILNSFKQYGSVPVMSLESPALHPLQSLADLMTIKEFTSNDNPKIVMTWAPHPKALPQSVPNSFAQWILRAGYKLTVAHPEGYELDPCYTEGAYVTYDQDEALKNADFVYVKNWSSYRDYGKVLNTDPSWQITGEKLSTTHKAKVMHCLPVRRNVVISDEVLDSEHSIVIEQARNRIFATQAVLKQILETH